jgi:hypothetical protein
MKSKKPNRRVAARAPQKTKCPVLPIALRVGELWAAHEAAEVREHAEKGDSAMSEQIEMLRMAVEDSASFERARSLAGALFQVGLAEEAATHLYELVPSEKPVIKNTFDKLIRLLDSVALLLRDECPAQDYKAVKDVAETYLNSRNNSLQWLDEIPELAKECRRSRKASAAVV